MDYIELLENGQRECLYESHFIDDSNYKGQIGSNKSSEIRVRFFGFSHALTFKIRTDDGVTHVRLTHEKASSSKEVARVVVLDWWCWYNLLS